MPTNSDELSEREREILRLVATGVSNKEIAYLLSISTNTVKVHLRNIFDKIGVASRTEAAMYAVNMGLVPGLSVAMGGEQRTPTEIPSEISASRLVLKIRWLLALVGLLAVIGILFTSYQLWRARSNTPEGSPDTASLPEWRQLAPMPTPRSGIAVADYNNAIYVIGGETKQEVTAIVERYDLFTDTWQTLSNKPTAVKDIGAASIGGRIYVPGGCSNTNTPSDILEIYLPDQDRWEAGARLPVAVCAYALTTFEGRLYLFGGWDGENYLDIVFEYDPRQDSWQKKTSMPTSRAYAGAVLSGDAIYVIGGSNGTTALATNEIYHPVLDQQPGGEPWKAGPPLPNGRYAAGFASLADIIYVVGGEGNRGESIGYLSFTPSTGTWGKIESRNAPMSSHLSLISLTTNLYAFGGILEGETTGQTLMYQVIYNIAIPILPVGQP